MLRINVENLVLVTLISRVEVGISEEENEVGRVLLGLDPEGARVLLLPRELEPVLLGLDIEGVKEGRLLPMLSQELLEVALVALVVRGGGA